MERSITLDLDFIFSNLDEILPGVFSSELRALKGQPSEPDLGNASEGKAPIIMNCH
ncbi:hypothetical protein NITGR_250037 [Nitrospina gracilis 3/211]|uniref:Uncharacterized protein n=1 Tax=Nitrospina gracilis (strain 3/211) TaxID=1266370 RepID=M1YXB2_NITG3|nr:hypothetical protein NITGR_250037 [Nitrospina gracilis 3/211]